MPNPSPTYKPIAGAGAAALKIENINALVAGTEYPLTLQSNLRSLTVRARNKANLQLAFVMGESGTKYITLRGEAVFCLQNLALASSILYIQADKPNTTVEVLQTYS